jgi:hypothetical protein
LCSPYPRAGPAGLLCSPYPRAGPRPQADPTAGPPLVTTEGPPRRFRSHAVARPPAPSNACEGVAPEFYTDLRPHGLRPHRHRPHGLRRRTALRVRNVLPPFGTCLVKGIQRAGRRRYPDGYGLGTRNGYGLGTRALRPHRPLPSRAMGHPTAPHKRTRRRTSAPAQAHDAAHNVCTRTSAHAQAHDAAHVCTQAQAHKRTTPHTTCAHKRTRTSARRRTQRVHTHRHTRASAPTDAAYNVCTPTTPAARARRGPPSDPPRRRPGCGESRRRPGRGAEVRQAPPATTPLSGARPPQRPRRPAALVRARRRRTSRRPLPAAASCSRQPDRQRRRRDALVHYAVRWRNELHTLAQCTEYAGAMYCTRWCNILYTLAQYTVYAGAT